MSLSTRTSINNDDILLAWLYMHNGTPYTISHTNCILTQCMQMIGGLIQRLRLLLGMGGISAT